jgi:predicted XRE-type DNA-binding protein
MDMLLLGIAFVIVVLLILAPFFIWINNNLNDPDEVDELEKSALIKLEIKKQLLNELHKWIQDNNLNHKQIGEKLSINRKTIANILYFRIDKFTVDRLLVLILKTGKNVIVSVSE